MVVYTSHQCIQCCTPIVCAMMHNSCQCVQFCTNCNNACAMAYKSTQVAHYLYGIPSKDIMYNIAHCHMYSAVQLTPTCTMLSQSRVHNVAHLRTTCTLHLLPTTIVQRCTTHINVYTTRSFTQPHTYDTARLKQRVYDAIR